jgi:hypothetical protein
LASDLRLLRAYWYWCPRWWWFSSSNAWSASVCCVEEWGSGVALVVIASPNCHSYASCFITQWTFIWICPFFPG